MSKDFDNRNRGALFVNERKEKDTHPSFTGRINIEGVEYWISAWGKTSKKGQKFLSLAVNKVEPRSNPSGPQSFDDFDEEIPFD